MKPATAPRDGIDVERLLVVDPCAERLTDARIGDLASYLRPSDLLVVNDAATLPASFRAIRGAGEPMEVRLASFEGDSSFRAVLFDGGSWRQKTEDRAAPPPVSVGDRLDFGGDLTARVVAPSAISPRLVSLRFDAASPAELWARLYRVGRPVQYAYLSRELALWDVQTSIAARPWAMELPSAGRPLSPRLLNEVRARGARVAWLTHGAGLSATGDPALDAALPLRERYDIPEATVLAIRETRAAGGRVVAVGTTVVRALESAATEPRGVPAAGEGWTDLRIGASHRLRAADGLLTGMHEPGTSHFELLRAFAPGPLLEAAHAHAASAGYLYHEFGDSCLILGSG